MGPLLEEPVCTSKLAYPENTGTPEHACSGALSERLFERDSLEKEFEERQLAGRIRNPGLAWFLGRMVGG
jgi:hypothetical protein